MILRIQRERQDSAYFPTLREYAIHYGLTNDRLDLAKKDAIVLHPGPMNRGIEISSDVADSSRSLDSRPGQIRRRRPHGGFIPRTGGARAVNEVFEIVGQITDIQTIAAGSGIREIKILRKRFGPGRWRKRKGTAQVKLQSGRIRLAELHWYEAHGIGKRKMKIKTFLD